MPATAGRVRMPANNRVHSSAALQTHGIWQSAIGYDPYAPNKDDSKSSSQKKSTPNASEPDAQNAYASFQGLLALARITGSNADEARGACKKCGRVGHLTFQCRNFVSVKDDSKDKDLDAVEAAVLSGLERIKGNGKIANKEEESEEEEEEESETSDSDVDSEIEKIIAERYGKKSSRGRSTREKQDDRDDDGSDSDDGERRKRGRSKKRRIKKRDSSDSEDEDEAKRKKRRKEKRRKRDESSDEEEEDRRRHKRKSRKEKRRRRSHRYSDDSDSDTSEDSGRRQRRKSRKAASLSDSDLSASDDSRVGRGSKRSEKRSKKRHREGDE